MPRPRRVGRLLVVLLVLAPTALLLPRAHAVGVIVALASVGLSMIFGVTGLVNFAHGELVTFGAVMAFLFNGAGGGPKWPLIPSAIVAVVIGGAFGWVLEKGLWRPLRRRRTGN